MNCVVCWIVVELLISEIVVGIAVPPILVNKLFVGNREYPFHHKYIVIDVVHHIGNIYTAEEFLDASEILFLFSMYTHI